MQNQPIPPSGSGRKGFPWKSILSSMRPGESIMIEESNYRGKKGGRDAAAMTARRIGIRIVCRYVDGGTMVWRIK